MKIYIFLLIFTIFINIICACSTKNTTNTYTWQNTPVYILISTNVPVEQRRAILAAINTWNKAYPGHTLFVLYSSDTYKRADVVISMAELPKGIEGRTYAQNNAKYIGAAIVYITWDNQCDTESVVLHELGHVMGLKHTKTGVMFPSLYPGEIKRDLDDNTLKYFHSLYPDIE